MANTTIWVAAITATSTLAAGWASSLLLWLSGGRQIRAQQTTVRRDNRRTAYLRFLDQADELDRILFHLTQITASASTNPLDPAVFDAAFASLGGALNVVGIEGPPEVVEAAQSLNNCYTQVAARIRLQELAERVEHAQELSREMLVTAARAATEARKQFVAAARKALGGDLPMPL